MQVPRRAEAIRAHLERLWWQRRHCPRRYASRGGRALDLKTKHVTDGGDSGGPLFIEGTHKLVGTETRFNPTTNKDFWARLDGAVYTWIAGRVTTHGGWGATSSRW